jgi:ABC-2 type transport system ATP-binding protein
MNKDVRLNARAAAVFHKVSKIYPGSLTRGRVVALDNVSFEVPWGQVFGLIGPNRAGKTTLVKILLSICHATGGRVMRLESGGSDRSTLAGVGYVHENLSFPRYLSACQVVEGYGRLSGVENPELRRRTAELLEKVGLADRRHDRIARFSKGMLQRLALAQALVNDPKLLVLDEPSEGMDLSARRLLHEVMRQRRERGYSVILVSHALDDVEKLCDSVAVLCGGRLVFTGSVDDLAGSEAAPSLESAVVSYYEEALA